MRRVDRGTQPGPAALHRRDGKGLSELDRARAHQGIAAPAPLPGAKARKKKAFAFDAYRSEEVKRRLETLFHGKCAYCESFYASTAPVDVEHYRPKGEVEGGDGHPGYWWLAMAWDNLLPSCIDCNRRRGQTVGVKAGDGEGLWSLAAPGGVKVSMGKQHSFPIIGARAHEETASLAAEEALLLDPSRDHPDDHLVFHADPATPIALVVPKAARPDAAVDALPLAQGASEADMIAAAARARGLSARGAVSIQVYGLNRLGLVQARTQLLRRLDFLETVVLDLSEVLHDLGRDPSLAGNKAVDHAIAKVAGLRERVIAEIREATKPGAPYSALARAWLKGFERRWSPGD
jgi:hypothetical protein